MSRLEFTAKVKVAAFTRAGGLCDACGCKLQPSKIQYDHVLPCALGGDNSLANCEALCTDCHQVKTSTGDVPRIRKADRQRAAHLGAKTSKSRPIPGSKASGLRKRMDGTVERRK